MGFYGSLRKEPAVERRLFGKQTHTAGINFDKYDDIPVEMSGRECPEGIETFEEMALPESLKENIVRCGYAKPTPIQKYSYGIGIANRDIMACAQTGSGKTGGFLFPAITLVLKAGPVIPEDQAGGSGGRHRGRKAYPSILILAPTRELASQINDEAEKFCYCTGLQPVVVYGGARAHQRSASRVAAGLRSPDRDAWKDDRSHRAWSRQHVERRLPHLGRGRPHARYGLRAPN